MVRLRNWAMWTAAGLLFAASALARAWAIAELPEIAAARPTAAPQVDGKLDDVCWQKAAKVTNFVLYKTGGKATVPTEAHVAYDDDYLYIAFRCSEPNPDKIQALAKQRDSGAAADDRVEVFIQPGGERYYHFMLSAANVQDDQRRGPGARGRNWDGVWKSATAIGTDAWTAEMAIPFCDLAQDISPGRDWTINLCRSKRTPPTETSSWSYSPEGFHHPERFGRLTWLDADLARFALRVNNLSAGKYSVEPKGYAYSVEAQVSNQSGSHRTLTSEVQDEPVGQKPSTQKLALKLANDEQKDIAIKVPIEKIAPRSLTFRLRDARTDQVCQVTHLKSSDFPPIMEAHLDRYYYTTQKNAKVIASMSLARPAKGRLQLHVTVIGEGGVVAKKISTVKDPARTEVALDIEKLMAGTYQVRLALVPAGREAIGEKALMLFVRRKSRAPGGEAPAYGAEANPTGDPIGGGAGYRRILAKGDYSVRTAEELLAALKEAKPGQVIYVAADKIDLTGHTEIEIPDGVTLAGNRGKDSSVGPLIFNNQMPQNTSLFNAGANVRVTGLRIKGPDADLPDIDYDVVPRSHVRCVQAVRPNVEVDNCEISNSHHSAVLVQTKNVHVHHCYIHDIHSYPIAVYNDARLPVLIEANIIRWVWTAFNGTGAPGSGYEACYNIIICDKPPESWGKNFKSKHAFGMHVYRRARPLRIATDRILIHHNTLEMGQSMGVHTDGVPREIMKVYNNWFSNKDPQQAVASAPGNVWVYNNVHGPDKTLVPIAMQTTPQILFKSLQQLIGETGKVRGRSRVKGRLALDIEVNVLKGLELKSVAIELDKKEIYSGDKAPQPGQVIINTAELTNGEHELSVTAADTRDVTAKHSVTLKVEN